MGGPAGCPTVYHNKITSVSRHHHIFNKLTQHLNIYQQYHITHQTNISTFRNRVKSISHLYHISSTSIVKQSHNTFTQISHHISTYHVNKSQQYHIDVTSVLKHYHISITPTSHQYHIGIISARRNQIFLRWDVP